MKKIKIVLVALLALTILSCEGDSPEEETTGTTAETNEEAITAENVINRVKEEREKEEEAGGEDSGGNFVFIKDLQNYEGTWIIKESRSDDSKEFIAATEIVSNELFFPATSDNLVNVQSIRIEAGKIVLIDANNTVQNEFGISNYMIGSLVIGGLFTVDLSSSNSTASNLISRITLTSNNGDLRIGQFFNPGYIEYRLEKVN
ncbi:hypothetical protein [Aquimarina algicola]|uniref:DUF4382 domain-containing protein n=1 Tax=Aquimarina algicola TaxID=2589995 RepID=A0A504J3L7_9FLAO|nr:hypothetical protein [Aquimarina algicola]TPN81669.1 hypothetical protein FHK87_24005 [Aquimarina algicola]